MLIQKGKIVFLRLNMLRVDKKVDIFGCQPAYL